MESYDPDLAPDSEEWKLADEGERLMYITDYVRANEPEVADDPSRLMLHAGLHNVVESQIALGDEVPTGAAMERLIAGGLSRHEAIHAAATVIVSLLFDPAQAKSDTWRREMEGITAESWLASFR